MIVGFIQIMWHKLVDWCNPDQEEYDDPYDNYWGSRIEDEWL